MTWVWRNNVVDEAGKPQNTTVASAFAKNQTKYQEELKSLDEWLGLIAE